MTYDKWFSERSLRDRRLRERALDSAARRRATATARTARCGSAPPTSATRRIAWSCARTAQTPISPPTSPTSSTSSSAASTCCSWCSAPTTTATSRACAPASRRWAEPGDTIECALVQFAILYRGGEKRADVHARRRVRHAARAARGSRQRRGALLLRDALQRPAPRLRPGAGQVAVQRQPGLLPPVRACARRERVPQARASTAGPGAKRRASPRSTRSSSRRSTR